MFPFKSARTSALCALVALSVPIAPAMAQTPAPSAPTASTSMATSWSYPAARRGDTVDDYHGIKVADPYRWLEDPDSAETRSWVEAENKITFGFLNQIPERQVIKDRLTKLWNYERYGVPFKKGDRTFYFKNDGLQNQSVLYSLKSLTDKPAVLLDPNTLSKDGTVALSDTSASHDGKHLAYALSSSGSDWQEWKIRDTATGKDLPETLKWVKFSSAAWTKDNKGFYYARYDEPKGGNKLQDVNYYQKLYYHRLGTPQAQDVLTYERKDQKEWGFGSTVTEDGNYLVLYITQGTDRRNRIHLLDLRQKGASVQPLLDDFDAAYDFVGNEGTVFWFKTTQAAPRGRLIAVDLQRPERIEWHEVIPQGPDSLQSVQLLNHQFVATYLKNAYSAVKIYGTDGTFVREVKLPGIGTISGFDGNPDDTETFYSFTSFTTPTTIYRYDMKTGKSTVFRQPKVDFDPAAYETKQVWYQSKDGTKVPMFVTYKKGIALDGSNPTYLYGYGGFDISLTPSFSVANLVWLEQGGVYAVPNLRGGGEFGDEWHLAGTKLRKQNVFDDFIAAAEWLVANQYTVPSRLSIGGGSNGGLLIGACLTQRPELFGAAVPMVGVLDMLRYQKFTIGWAWASDYGTSDDADEFRALYAYSPLHNVKPGTSYPPTLVTTADHDDRVVPAHSFKFAAALQAAQGGNAPVLIRIDSKAGHGAGKPTAKVIDEASDRWAFLLRVLRGN